MIPGIVASGQMTGAGAVAPDVLDAKVGSFNVSTATAGNTVAVTGVGFTPKLLIFWWSGTTASGNLSVVDTTDLRAGFGCATSPTERRADFFSADDASDPAASDKTTANDYCIGAHVPGAGTISGKLDLQSMDADGFTMIVDQQFSVDLRVHYLALAHASMLAKIGSFTGAGSTGNQTVSSIGLGGTPTCLILFGRDLSTTVSAQFHIGVSDGTNAWTYDYTDQDNQPTTNTRAYLRAGEVRASVSAATMGTTRRATFVSFGSDEFTINWTETAGTLDLQYIAIGGIQAAVGSSNSSADNFTVSGLAFAPAAFMLLGHGQLLSSADAPQNNAVCSLGAATSATERRVAYFDSPNGANSTEIHLTTREDSVLLQTGRTTTIADQVDVQSFDSGGFTLVRDVDANTDMAHAWVAFGPPAA